MSGSIGMIGGLAVLALFVVLLVWSLDLTAPLRRRRLVELAARREWDFAPEARELQWTFKGPPFGVGRSRSPTNAVRGRYEGHDFVAFDYEYTTGKARANADAPGPSVTRVAVTALGLDPSRPSPAMVQAAPRTRVGRTVEGDVGTEIVLGDAEFDERFTVRTTSEELAQALLGRSLTAHLLANADRAWRVQGRWLLTLRPGRLRAREIDATLASMREAVQHCRCT